MAKRTWPKWLKPVLTWGFYVVLAVFIVYYLVHIKWSEFDRVQFNLWWLLVAAVAALTVRYWQTFIWITILRGLGARNAKMNAAFTHVYAKSWLGRYIPGTAPWILGKIYFASQHGVSKSKLAVGSLLEGVIQIATLLLTSSISLLLDPRLRALGPSYILPIIAVAVCAIIVLIPPIFNSVVGLAFRILRRPSFGPENRAGWRVILTAVGMYTVGAFISGIYLLAIVKTLYPSLPGNDSFFVIAVGNLAGAVSMVAIFAPGGVGVRELIQLTLLGIIIPRAIAAVVVVLTRLTGIIADLLFFAITWVASRGWRGSAPPPAEQSLEESADASAKS